MTFNRIDTLNNAQPGDIIFYSSRDCMDSCSFTTGQTLCPSISKMGAMMTHTAIVLSKRHVFPIMEDPSELTEEMIAIAHSSATIEGPHISIRGMDRLVTDNKKIIVFSPINKKEIGEDREKENQIRNTISEVALQFSTEDPRCPHRPCTKKRMLFSPILEFKFSSKARFRNKVAKGLVDFILGYPRIEKFDKNGKPIAKTSFCSEFAHSVLQTAHFFELMNPDEIKKIQTSFIHLREHPEDLQKRRNEHIKYIEKNFDRLFPEEGRDTGHWTHQKSISFAPGRLFTVLKENGNDFFTAKTSTNVI